MLCQIDATRILNSHFLHAIRSEHHSLQDPLIDPYVSRQSTEQSELIEIKRSEDTVVVRESFLKEDR